MSDSSAHGEHPSRFRKVGEMDFRQLRQFIDDALKRPSSFDPGDELPRLKEEFVELAGILREKVEEELARNEPSTPEPEYVERPPYPFSGTSDQLASAYERRERLSHHLRDALNEGSSQRYVQQLESDLRVVEQEIAERENAQEQVRQERLAEYERAYAEYEHSKPLQQAHRRKQQERQQLLARRSEIVRRIERDIRRTFKSGTGLPTEYVHWRILPPGKLSEGNVRGYYAGLRRRNPGIRYDEQRIVKALQLGPNHRYEEREGSGGVEGYVIFTFPHTSKVLMECPKVGNAAYVIDSALERWSKMTKSELIEEADRGGEVTRIPHRGDWFGKIKRQLDISEDE